jgi:hypothetical protein
MRTAPSSLGVPLLGHTFALARAVGRYPCTWDLFSIWSQATAPVRRRFRAHASSRRLLQPRLSAFPDTVSLLRPVLPPAATQEPVRVQIFTEQCAVIGDPALMKRVLQTNMKNYAKDLDFSYSPFIVRAALRRRRPRCARAVRDARPHALDAFAACRTCWALAW